jgi:hypothetical protein
VVPETDQVVFARPCSDQVLPVYVKTGHVATMRAFELFLVYKFSSQLFRRLIEEAHLTVPAWCDNPEWRLLSQKCQSRALVLKPESFCNLLVVQDFSRVQVVHLQHSAVKDDSQILKVRVDLCPFYPSLVPERLRAVIFLCLAFLCNDLQGV